jgi:aminocarboxymuconate-semialdehyde decarboxylase
VSFPNVTVIAATLGGTLPFLAHRFDRGLLQDCPERYEELGGVLPHLRRFFYDTSVVEEPLALLNARQAYGADRLVLGTDYARPGVRSSAAVEYVTSSEYLTDAEKAATLGGNAATLLHAALRERGALPG